MLLVEDFSKCKMTGREVAEKLYREGKLPSLATQRSLSKDTLGSLHFVMQHKATISTLHKPL